MLEYFNLKQDTLHIGGLKLSTLIEKWGTPLYVYDWEIAKKKLKMVKEALPFFDIFYSVKANPNLSISALFNSIGSGAEVASKGELYLALKAGFQPKDIIFVGPGKTDEELEYAINSNIYAIVAESLNEIKRIDMITEKLRKYVGVMIRVNTKVPVDFSYEKMVGGPSKFGIDEEDLNTLAEFDSKNIQLLGIHVYTASQVLDVGSLLKHNQRVLNIACSFSSALGSSLQCVDFGGGFGVPYAEDETEFDLSLFSKGMKDLIKKKAEEYNLEATRFILELGRYLVAECGVYLTKVIDIKESRGKKYLITDGGMNQQIRPIFMKLNHPTFIVNKLNKKKTEKIDIGGPCCTPFDILAKDITVPEPEIGDIVGIFNSGAYGFSMSMLNFHSHPWPVELLIIDGEPILIRERIKVEDCVFWAASKEVDTYLKKESSQKRN